MRAPKAQPDFSDLVVRIGSAVALIGLCVVEIWLGGDAFGVLLVIVGGLMGWEVSRMHSYNAQVQVLFGALLAATVLCWAFVSPLWALFCGLLVVAVALAQHTTPVTVIGWAAAVGTACAALQVLRDDWGLGWTLWVLVVVAASDIGGYFAGKLFGGPKILPRISPKKTWSGTLGGWVLAAAVGYGAHRAGVGPLALVALSVPLAMTAQLGDLMESLMKRRSGVKDSSSLLPGHGGLLDRFDGTVGASCAMALVMLIGVTP